MVRPCIRPGRRAGFTLVELLVVLAIVALMLSLALPRYLPRIDAARERVLAENLHAVRETLLHFYGDTGRYPESLQELVDRKYLAALPVDPLTERSDTWIVKPPEEGEAGGVFDIRSGAPGSDREGKPYAQW